MTSRVIVSLLIMPFPWAFRKFIFSLLFGYKFAAGSLGKMHVFQVLRLSEIWVS